MIIFQLNNLPYAIRYSELLESYFAHCHEELYVRKTSQCTANESALFSNSAPQGH